MLNIHIYRTGKVNTGYWCRDMRKRDNLEDLGIDGRIILNLVLKNTVHEGGNQFICVISTFVLQVK
jgi:hypothetical protein